MTYWKRRATVYNNLDWVKDKQFLNAIVASGGFRRSDIVLDAGTGTGIIAETVAPLVKRVVALDVSPHMMSMATNHCRNIEWLVGDMCDLKFAANTFDIIAARHVFHHILGEAKSKKAMAECYRVLKHDGVMVFAEGVPPSQRTKQDFIEIFKLKEKRVTFMPEDMVDLMVSVGFAVVSRQSLRLKRMSVRNWVCSGGTPKPAQKAIFLLHRNAPSYFKEDYRMVETEDDCLIDMRMEILTGVKY